MDLPRTGPNNVGIHPGGQGAIHMSIVADPGDANIVYIGGDRQPFRAERPFAAVEPPLQQPQRQIAVEVGETDAAHQFRALVGRFSVERFPSKCEPFFAQAFRIRTAAEKRQHGGVGVSEAMLGVEAVDEVRDR